MLDVILVSCERSQDAHIADASRLVLEVLLLDLELFHLVLHLGVLGHRSSELFDLLLVLAVLHDNHEVVVDGKDRVVCLDDTQLLIDGVNLARNTRVKNQRKNHDNVHR
jgi:hypothetical protein